MDMFTTSVKASALRQVEPNAVNVEAFHSPVLEAGEKYQSFTAYKFDVRK